jgi:hypothetical protein
MTCLSVGVLRNCQVFSVSCKTVYRWVATDCCFRSDRPMCFAFSPSSWSPLGSSSQRGTYGG